MSHQKEELQAALLWCLVERVRDLPSGDEPIRFSPDEVAELGELLNAAAATPAALSHLPVSAGTDAVWQQLTRTGTVAGREGRPATDAPEGRPARRPWFSSPWFPGLSPLTAGNWRWYAVLSALAATSIALLTVGIWGPVRVVERVLHAPTAGDPGEVDALTEQQASVLIPRMVQFRLGRRDERSLMWHMLVCPGCYEKYVALRDPMSRRRTSSVPLIRQPKS